LPPSHDKGNSKSAFIQHVYPKGPLVSWVTALAELIRGAHYSSRESAALHR